MLRNIPNLFRAEELNSVRQKLSAAMADNSGLVRYNAKFYTVQNKKICNNIYYYKIDLHNRNVNLLNVVALKCFFYKTKMKKSIIIVQVKLSNKCFNLPNFVEPW